MTRNGEIRLVHLLRARHRRVVLMRAALEAGTWGLAGFALLFLVGSVFSPGWLPVTLGWAIPVLMAVAGGGRMALQLRPGPDARSLALLAEVRVPELQHALVTLLEDPRDGPVHQALRARVGPVLERVSPERVLPLRPGGYLARLGWAAAVTAVLLLVTGGGRGGRASKRSAPGVAELGVPDARMGSEPPALFGSIEAVVRPPAYTGMAAVRVSGVSAIRALPGSEITLSGRLSGRGSLQARVVDGESRPGFAAGGNRPGSAVDGNLTVSAINGGWSASRTLGPGDTGIDLILSVDGEQAARRVIPVIPIQDRVPVVVLDSPDRDLLVATPSGRVSLEAVATDDFGVVGLELTWVRSSGSGESFAFEEGTWAWDRTLGAGGTLRGSRELDLAMLGLRPGDVLHVRVVAKDGNDVTGPGVGVSATRQIRIARPDEMELATTIIGFPIERDREPVLSQRMIILLTEELMERSAGLTREGLLSESGSVADEQARLRNRIGEQIFSRATGAMQDPEAHPELQPLSSGGETEAPITQTGPEGHLHDSDPILSVNQRLLDAYNAMWAAERQLRQAALSASMPHQQRALEILQELRQGERVFARGRVAVAPVDLPAVRGTGELNGAVPGDRERGPPLTGLNSRLGALEGLASTVRGMPPAEALARLSEVTVDLLALPKIDPEVIEMVAAAAWAAEQGATEEAVSLLLRARDRLAPGDRAVGPGSVTFPTDGAGAEYLRHLRSGGAPLSPVSAAAQEPEVFVFATVRYASGDWDSAPLVPANLIHSLAQYTDLRIAPEGVTVDLTGSELFRYPFLYLTGHLPVLFSDEEARNLCAYVERGGFLFIDDHNHDIDGAFHRSVMSELARIFGADALQPLPSDHGLYRSLFEFEDGPPITGHELSGWGDGLIHRELHAVRTDGRISILYSNKDYSSEWSYHPENKRFLALDNTRFGVNIILYALTR